MTATPPLDPAVQSVLAVALHPDDLESWCGGTLARFVADDARVAYVVVTSGDKGSADPRADPRLVGARREAEQIEAARLLGVRDVTFLRYRDGEVEDTMALRVAIAREIRRHRPQVLMTFDPWAPYTFHHDHREGSLAALAAAFPLSGSSGPLPGDHASQRSTPHAAHEAWFFNSPRVNRIVDVTAYAPRKIAARLAHASQVGDASALTAAFTARMRATGEPVNAAAGEAFHVLRFPRATSLDRHYVDL